MSLTNVTLKFRVEATSSIDTRTEKLVQDGMDNLMEGRTVFVIAHRLSTVENADKIVVMDQGQVVDQGTHDDLLARGGLYADLYRLQYSDGKTITDSRGVAAQGSPQTDIVATAKDSSRLAKASRWLGSVTRLFGRKAG